MKIRTGYVSNSSSSSFVAVGYILEDKSKTRYVDLIQELDPTMSVKEIFEDYGCHFEKNGISVICGDIDEGIKEGKTFVGKKLLDYYDINEFSDEQFEIDEIKEKLELFEKYLLPEEFKLKLLTGTRTC